MAQDEDLPVIRGEFPDHVPEERVPFLAGEEGGGGRHLGRDVLDAGTCSVVRHLVQANLLRGVALLDAEMTAFDLGQHLEEDGPELEVDRHIRPGLEEEQAALGRDERLLQDVVARELGGQLRGQAACRKAGEPFPVLEKSHHETFGCRVAHCRHYTKSERRSAREIHRRANHRISPVALSDSPSPFANHSTTWQTPG